MDKKEQARLNHAEYSLKYHKENMASITGKFQKNFVYDFKDSCKRLNISQASVYRDAMQKVIDKATELDKSK